VSLPRDHDPRLRKGILTGGVQVSELLAFRVHGKPRGSGTVPDVEGSSVASRALNQAGVLGLR
jgi:hypothetical protein